MEQKYNDLKKALKLVFEKSEELEKITISDELKEVITKIKDLKHKSQEKDSIYQELATKKFAKEQELAELKKSIIASNKIKNEIYLSQLTELLEKQEILIKNNNEEATKRLELVKGMILMLKIATEEEVNQLCQKQIEITQLAIQLEKITNQGVKQLTHIINNINIQQGNAFIGNPTFGNSANFTYNTNMEIPPK